MVNNEVQNKINIKAYLSAADKFWMGGQLRSLRQARGIGVPEAARLIHGTQSQILAIESGSQGPFGSTENYVQGILTYASLYEIAPDSALGGKLAELTALTTGTVKEQSSASGIDTLMQSSLPSTRRGLPLPRLKGQRVLFAVLGVGVLLFFVLTALDVLPFSSRLKSTLGLSPAATESSGTAAQTVSDAPVSQTSNAAATTQPVAPAKESDLATAKIAQAPQPLAEQNASTQKTAAKSASGDALSFKFNAPCWIQATGLDGKVTEKIYGVNDQLVLDPAKLKALIIGNVEATTVTNSKGATVQIKTFANQSSKVARLKEQELSQLTRDRN